MFYVLCNEPQVQEEPWKHRSRPLLPPGLVVCGTRDAIVTRSFPPVLMTIWAFNTLGSCGSTTSGVLTTSTALPRDHQFLLFRID